MPYVITEPCIGCKDGSCKSICPVDCIFDGGEQLFIDPSDCIDCGFCVKECPVEAIFKDERVPIKWLEYTERNRLAAAARTLLAQSA